jgi:ribonuclease HII
VAAFYVTVWGVSRAFSPEIGKTEIASFMGAVRSMNVPQPCHLSRNRQGDGMTPSFAFEDRLRAAPNTRIAGVDEAGRGPLAGPVVAAAVVLDPTCIPPGLNDSKALTARKRDALLDLILNQAEVGIGEASVDEIDRINILRASHLAMCRAIAALPQPPDHVLIDGNMCPCDLVLPSTPIVKGDSLSLSIAAASIVAKTRRDAIMWDLAQQYPGYGWETNQGYPTKCHKDALRNLGVTPHHRRSFRPVYNIL